MTREFGHRPFSRSKVSSAPISVITVISGKILLFDVFPIRAHPRKSAVRFALVRPAISAA